MKRLPIIAAGMMCMLCVFTGCRANNIEKADQDRYIGYIRSSLEVNDFNFELTHTDLYGVTAPLERKYEGVMGKWNDSDIMYGFECIQGEMTKSDNENYPVSKQKEEISHALFSEKNITNVQEIAAGYEVYYKDKDGFTGSYTIIYDEPDSSIHISKIIGHICKTEGKNREYYDIRLTNFDYPEEY